MSRIFPHPPYAEDQPYPRTILTYHVLARAWQTGAVLGLGVATARSLLRRQKLWISTIALPTTGSSALLATALMVPGIPLYMSGKTEIEWQDRSWRLLGNRGQVEVDDWSSLGFLGGLLLAGQREVLRGSARVGLGWGLVSRVAGGAAVGDLIGVLGYMGWRYGVHRGRWSDEG